MASDTDLCLAATLAYASPPTWVADGDVHGVLTERGGISIVAFRGTVPTSLLDWLRDFMAWPHICIDHPQLGWTHEGFMSGAEAILPVMAPALAGKQVILTGHSLGGALALAVGALMVLAGTPPMFLTTFGAPRVGRAAFGKLLAGVPGERYCNGNDPVPGVPHLLYEHDRPLKCIGTDEFIPIEAHPILRYGAALAAVPISTLPAAA